MDCEEFWEKWADGFGVQKRLPEEMQDHLKQCSLCSREHTALQQGFLALRHEIEEEESAHFWHGLRQNVRASIQIPKKRFQWTLSWQKIGWATAGVVLFLFFFKSSLIHNPCILEEDLLLLTGVDPITSVYVDSELRQGDEDEEMLDSHFYRGITESWTSLLDQAVEKPLLKQGNSYHPDHVRQDNRIRDNGMGLRSEILKG